jgi:hypothetical protein
MRIVRALAPIAVAAALAVIPAPAAHAGCTDDLVAAFGHSNFQFVLDPSRYAEVSGLDVTVHGDAVIATATGLVGIVEGRVVYIVAAAPGALVAFADCVS